MDLSKFRIADSMVAAVPLLGIAGVLGHTLGVFIGNIFSSAGPIDFLNTIPSFAMSFVVYYIYKRTKNDYYRNRNLHRLLVRLRHNSRMDAVLPIRFATASHNRIRCHRKHHCHSANRMAHLQITKKNRLIPEMV